MKQKWKQHLSASMAVALFLSFAGCGTTSSPEAESSNSETPVEATGIIFSHSGGLYETELALALSTDIASGTIRYTLDGSDPTSQSTPYTEELIISDRTEEENLLSAIVAENSGGFGGGQGGSRGEGMPPSMPNGGGQGPQGNRMTRTDTGDNIQSDETTPPDMAEEDIQAERTPPESGLDDTEPVQPGEDNEGQGFAGGGGRGLEANSTSTAPAENVFKGTVVKAAVFSESGEMLSDISVQSYFVSEDIFSRYGDLPLVSVVTDASNFFDEDIGIYTNYEESGSDWERPVYFEMFEADGTSAVAQSMGVRINGGTTRSLSQKALRFYAKNSYDEENPTIEYELFEGLTKSYSDDLLTSFKRVILRSGGNDNSGSLFRDDLMQSLVSNLNLDTQASRPCIAFVNGEFWGIYNIRERYDDHYFANHYDIDAANVAVLEISNGSKTPEVNEGDESDLAYYNQMVDFFNSSSMSDQSNYQKAQEYIDIDNLIDYFIANIYSGNSDWPANNNVFWRYKTESGGYDSTAEWYMDGRFRWVVKDMDWGFGLMSSVSGNTLLHALNENASSAGRGGGMGFTSAESTLLFRKLLENEEFQAKFINRFCDIMNTNYDADTVTASIEAMKSQIAVAIEEQANRYPSSVSSVSAWETSIDKMIQFAQERSEYMQSFLQSRFSLANVTSVTLHTDKNAGYIRINNTDITDATKGGADCSVWSGDYFTGTIQTLTAIPVEGHTFVKFVVTDNASGTTAEYVDSAIDITVGNGGITVQAVFE